MNIIGIDLGKTVSHLVVMNPAGAVIAKKRLSRAQLIALLGNTPPSLVAMEASCGAHYLGRQFVGYGHDVKLNPAQFVRPFVKSQKNDYVDAEASAGLLSSISFAPFCWNAGSSFVKVVSSCSS